MKKFSENLKSLRIAQNLKQSDIAKLIYVTVAQISDIERGRSTTSIDKLYILADFFNVSTDYLLGRTDNPAINK